MKKIIGLLGMITVLSFGHGLLVSAEDTTVIPEKTLDTFLKEAGAPNELLLRWEYDQKLDLYEKGQEGKIEFDTSEQVEFIEKEIPSRGEPVTELIEAPKSGSFSATGTISSKNLKVSHDIWSMYYKDVKYKSVYANYHWGPGAKFRGTKGDKIAIAIPAGWSIKAKSYECKEFQSSDGIHRWLYKASCGGAPYDLDFYGAVWNLTRSDGVRHKGWASFDMKRTSKKAQLKVLSKYIEDTGSSKTWSIGWGPMSVSINGDKKDNRVAWDTSFKY